MNIVLYTVDFEPITVLELPLWLIEQLERQGTIKIAVQEPPGYVDETTPVADTGGKTVTVHCYKLRWRDNTTKTVLVTADDELALTLRPNWLPGQQGTVNQYKTLIANLTSKILNSHKRKE